MGTVMSETPFPGGILRPDEFNDVIRILCTTPVSFFLVVDTSGNVMTFPPFQPTAEIPDLPTLLRWMAGQIEGVPDAAP